MDGQKKILFGLPASPQNIERYRTRQDHVVDERRRVMAEERTGQIVILAPSLGYTALEDLYFDDAAITEQPCLPEDTLHPEQLAFSDIH